jgi:hypothetical protein
MPIEITARKTPREQLAEWEAELVIVKRAIAIIDQAGQSFGDGATNQSFAELEKYAQRREQLEMFIDNYKSRIEAGETGTTTRTRRQNKQTIRLVTSDSETNQGGYSNGYLY